MLSNLRRLCIGMSLLFGAASPLCALTATSFEQARTAPAAVKLHEESFNDAKAARVSLREDVGRHPSEFLCFETRTSANRFIAEHAGAFHETERRVVLRGVIGYWQGKTLVVLPSLSLSSR
jgi:hypothetical protein